jgi:hypothetical protein
MNVESKNIDLVQGSVYLDDLDRGDIDCQGGYEAPANESEAYYIGYGARYVFEQMKSAGEFN